MVRGSCPKAPPSLRIARLPAAAACSGVTGPDSAPARPCVPPVQLPIDTGAARRALTSPGSGGQDGGHRLLDAALGGTDRLLGLGALGFGLGQRGSGGQE